MNDDRELLISLAENIELLRLAAVGLAQQHREAQALADYCSSVQEWLSEQQAASAAVMH